MIRLTCPCGKRLQTKDEYAGRRIRCPGCKRDLVVEASSQQVESAAPARRRPAPGATRPGGGDEGDKEDRWTNRSSATRGGMAVASLTLGIFALVCSICSGFPAVILGILSLRDIRQAKNRVTG